MTNDRIEPDDHPLQPPAPAQAPVEPGVQRRGTPLDDAGACVDTRDQAEEAEIWVGRTHWKHYAGRILAWAVCNLAFTIGLVLVALRRGWADPAGCAWLSIGALTVSGVLVIGRLLLRVLSRRYRVTSQRLFIEQGILSQTVDQTELIRVDDVRLYKTVVDRVFGLGSVAVVSTDATDQETVLEGIRDPERVAESIRSNMRVLRQKSLFIENL